MVQGPGVHTTTSLHRALLRHPEFQADRHDVLFLDRERPALLATARGLEASLIVCELLEVEHFELGFPRLFSRPAADHAGLDVLGLLLTLECAFGVTIDPDELGGVSNLAGVHDVVRRALAQKRRRTGLTD